MPKYKVTAIDGNTYEFDAPEGMSKHDIYKHVNSQIPQNKPADYIDQLARTYLMTGRTIYEGFTSPATTLLEGLRGVYNLGAAASGSDNRIPSVAAAQKQMLDSLQLPTPTTSAERVAQGGIKAMAGGASLAKLFPNSKYADDLLTKFATSALPPGMSETLKTILEERKRQKLGESQANDAVIPSENGLFSGKQ
jgi:hypothetical protein